MVYIAPSLLAADFSRLAEEIERIERADMLHVDVMDGHFVPNLSIGPPVIEALRKKTGLPFDVHLINLDPKNAEVSAKADEIHVFLEGQGVEVLYDDRDERPGVKFKDADLIGLPAQIIVGGKSLAGGVVETKNRRTGEKSTLPAGSFAEAFPAFRQAILDSWQR